MKLLSFLFVTLFSFPLLAQSPQDLRSLGSKDAPYTMYLFTSLTCPHCADFHNKILPKIEQNYIKTGRARLMIVDLAADKNGLWATLALRCIPAEKTVALENKLYNLGPKWKDITDVQGSVKNYIKQQGVDQKQFNTCISDPTLKQDLLEQQNNLSLLYGVRHMPTLVLRHGNEVNSWEGTDAKTIMADLKDLLDE